jgi:hypothetical protein
MSNKIYEFKQTEDNRWGIYFQDRLLATFGSYEICQFMGQYLKNNLSTQDYQKSAIADRRVISNQSKRLASIKKVSSYQ